jgi:hypothetical protein
MGEKGRRSARRVKENQIKVKSTGMEKVVAKPIGVWCIGSDKSDCAQDL